MNRNGACSWYLAIGYIAPYLALAITSRDEIIEVRQYRARSGDPERARRLIAAFAAEYGVRILVVRSGTWLELVARSLAHTTLALTLGKAKAVLLPGASRPTHPELYSHLVREHPELRRLVTYLPFRKKVAVSEPWRTVTLLAVALGLAAARLRLGERRSPHTTRSSRIIHSLHHV